MYSHGRSRRTRQLLAAVLQDPQRAGVHQIPVGYTHAKYQFAFLAYHMLAMSFVYFNIWQIRQTEPGNFAMGLIGFGKDIEKSLLDATSPFVFSTVNERSILREGALASLPGIPG
ncbi:hypothetical protein [Metallibacterium sp.]|uniref:hypothetical protein n=1 Tax=Metallibacterium sp. TaxID=2940281 RepID=UPI0026273438|nr:hypothetical protein [Metallibacterium sp.]